jgi:hypothetical protein
MCEDLGADVVEMVSLYLPGAKGLEMVIHPVESGQTSFFRA